MKAQLQAIVNRDEQPKINYYPPRAMTALKASVKPIKRVSRSGGGAKGADYPGSFEADVETGVHAKVEHEAGASAGAITSAFIACGIKHTVLREVILKENFKQLLGSRVKDRTKPGVSIATKDGNPLLKLIRDNIGNSIKTFLQAHAHEIADNDDIDKILDKVNKEKPITFADLALLHEKWPKDFKYLSVIAVEYPSGKPQIFDHRTTPNVEIALACRASASLPVFLEPVEIDFGNGIKQRFVDGGLWDNTPVNYFDIDEKGNFQKNTMPDQTLIYAFGEGLDDAKNQVFQAQFGSRMNEILGDSILSDVLTETIADFQSIKRVSTALTPQELLEKSLNHALNNFIETSSTSEEKKIFQNIAQTIRHSAKKYVHDLIQNPEKYPVTYQKLKEASSIQKAAVLTEFLKEKITPVLYEAGIVERLKRNKLITFLGGMRTPYKNTDQKEKGYQKIRSEYPLRTVELRVGNIKTTDFNLASKYARVMNTLGYLDTINNHINHDLYDSNVFDPKIFFQEIIKNFEQIHLALLNGSNANHKDNPLLVEIGKLKNKLAGMDDEIINRKVFYIIKQYVERNPDSAEAFALSRAHEFRSRHIDANQLFKEIYEESFRRSPLFSRSKISGQSIYTNASLHKVLEKQNMFHLNIHNNTRSGKIFSALTVLKPFQEEAKAQRDNNQSEPLNEPIPPQI